MTVLHIINDYGINKLSSPKRNKTIFSKESITHFD